MDRIASKVGPGAYDPQKPQVMLSIIKKMLSATMKGKLTA